MFKWYDNYERRYFSSSMMILLVSLSVKRSHRRTVYYSIILDFVLFMHYALPDVMYEEV